MMRDTQMGTMIRKAANGVVMMVRITIVLGMLLVVSIRGEEWR